MANTKISALGAAAALGGTETIPGVQSGVTVKLTPAQIKTYANTSPVITGNMSFGGVTSAQPALRATGAAVDVILADASAYGPINASQFIAQTSGFKFTASSVIKSPTDGNIILYDAAQTTFGRVQFGGTTSSFPALRRSATALDAVLADASAFTAFNASQFIAQTSGFKFNASTLLIAPADGTLRIANNAGTSTGDFTVSGASTTGTSLLTAGGGLAATTYLKSGSYTVATVPSASTSGASARIYVSDETGGATPAFSDATNWRRYADRAIIA